MRYKQMHMIVTIRKIGQHLSNLRSVEKFCQTSGEITINLCEQYEFGTVQHFEMCKSYRSQTKLNVSKCVITSVWDLLTRLGYDTTEKPSKIVYIFSSPRYWNKNVLHEVADLQAFLSSLFSHKWMKRTMKDVQHVECAKKQSAILSTLTSWPLMSWRGPVHLQSLSLALQLQYMYFSCM